jgi:type IV secretion system protein VirD4
MRLKGARKSRRDPSKIVRAGDMLVFVSGRPPILGRQALYFQSKTLLARSLMTPAGESPAGERDDDGEKNGVEPGPGLRAGDAIRRAAGSPSIPSLPNR